MLPAFGPPGWRFSGLLAQGGEYADELLISDIGGLLPIALWGLTVKLGPDRLFEEPLK